MASYNFYKNNDYFRRNSTEKYYIELIRRIALLQYQRQRLTTELTAINSAIKSLNEQVKSFEASKETL